MSRHPETKVANQQEGQGSSEQQFESSFFQLAYEKLQNKGSKMLPFFVGFEIVNKSEDYDKALGVFGFKADNGQILYAPTFFINGKVKELDIMYSRNNNQYYPFNEDFAELFLSDDVTGLGTPADEQRKKLERSTGSSRSMRDLAYPPTTGRIVQASVLDYVAESPNKVKQAALDLIDKHPEFLEGLLRFYPIEKISEALVQVKQAEDLPVQVFFPDNAPSELYAEALTDGYAVLDKRASEDISRVGDFECSQQFSTVTEPGVYAYVTKAGVLNHGLVLNLSALRALDAPGEPDKLVVNLGETARGHAYLIDSTKAPLYAKSKEGVETEAVEEFYSKLANPVEVTPDKSVRYVLVDKSLKASAPFCVLENFLDHDGVRRLRVELVTGCLTTNERVLTFTKKPGDKIVCVGKNCYVPKGFKLFSFFAQQSEDSEEARAFVEMMAPGCMSCLTAYLEKNAVVSLEVKTNGTDYNIKAGRLHLTYKNKLAAKVGMVQDLNLDKATAEELISKAAFRKPIRGTIKFANLGSYVHQLPDPNYYTNELGQPTFNGDPYISIAPTDDAYRGDPTEMGLGVTPGAQQGGIPQEALQAAQMAELGQKEIFDTSSIAMLAKYTDPGRRVLSYIPNFVDSLDKLGRILFLVHWEMDKFQKMYGSTEMPELVELLKNVFKNLGDLVIFLKRKFPEVSINVSEQDMIEN